MEYRMISTCLTLKDVSHVLPDGRTLFVELNESFDLCATGLVGRNGVGKTLLAHILAGQLQPSTGYCLRSGHVHYLAQQVTCPENATVANLAGVQRTMDALARIESGSLAAKDFDAVGDRWDIRQRFRHELERNDLGHLKAATPASTLSGGETMRVALIGALLSEADFLILDEPSNHLDRPNRRALIEQLESWPRGLIVISHDRQLLNVMARIVELSPQGLRNYGGNFSVYAQRKAQERENASGQLNQRKLERQREQQAMRKQRERQARRQARGHRQGKAANQASILLDRQKERSEHSAGVLQQKQTETQAQLNQRVRDAAQQLADEAEIAVHDIGVKQAARRRVAKLEDVQLPFVRGATRHISLTLTGQQRVGVLGPNGCGKSTLLRVLAGQLAHLAGTCEVTSERAYLDQRLGNLDPKKTVLEQLQSTNRTATEGDLRMRLAQLGLDARMVETPSGSLSGGERLKGSLACVLYADPPPKLLLLDEPNNHLDLPSARALETMLRSYQGSLLVVSHDDVFLDSLGLTNRLIAATEGWSLEPA